MEEDARKNRPFVVASEEGRGGGVFLNWGMEVVYYERRQRVVLARLWLWCTGWWWAPRRSKYYNISCVDTPRESKQEQKRGKKDYVSFSLSC
jgi:hypothetical protein